MTVLPCVMAGVLAGEGFFQSKAKRLPMDYLGRLLLETVMSTLRPLAVVWIKFHHYWPSTRMQANQNL